MNCDQCKKYPECYGFAAMFGRCNPDMIPAFDPEKVERDGHDGFVERPRVPFQVLDI